MSRKSSSESLAQFAESVPSGGEVGEVEELASEVLRPGSRRAISDPRAVGQSFGEERRRRVRFSERERR